MLSAERIALLKHGAPPRNALEAALRNAWYGGGASYEKTVGPAPIISISDAKSKPAKSLIVGMEPIQAGSGDPSPDNIRPISGRTGVTVERTGANLFSATPTQGKNIESDGSVVNAPARTATVDGIRVLAEQEYTVSYGNTSVRCGVFFYDDSNAIISYLAWGNAPRTFTTPKHTAFVRFSFDSNTVILSPQLNISSSALPYDPYTGTSYPVVFPDAVGTVYGGTVDVVSGVLTVTHGTTDLTNLGWSHNGGSVFTAVIDGIYNRAINTQNDAMSNKYSGENVWYGNQLSNGRFMIRGDISRVYIKDENYLSTNEFVNSLGSLQFIYKLATPQTYQLTPQQIQLLKGSNTLWSDADDLTLTYIGTEPANLLGGMLGGGLGGGYTPPSEEPEAEPVNEEPAEEPTEGDGE